MFCNQCGARLPAGVAYCTHCGKAVGPAGAPTAATPATAMSAATGRVAKHRNALGVLWLVLGVWDLPKGMVLIGFSSMGAWGGRGWGMPWSGMPHFVGPLLGSIGVGVLALAILSIVTGIGLLMAQSWARMLAIVVGIIRLINIPFGTALGIYTLWVLLPDQSNVEYGQLTQQRARV
ncbi:MAG: zinc ribbon domain-containing protein [Terriglobales bacterium]